MPVSWLKRKLDRGEDAKGWPRRLVNFPIVMLATLVQSCMVVALLADPAARLATHAHILSVLFPSNVVPIILAMAVVAALCAFTTRRKTSTMVLLAPQQLLLYLSAGGALHAAWIGHYADDVARSHAFILVDQCPIIFIAIFHTWAMLLILVYGED